MVPHVFPPRAAGFVPCCDQVPFVVVREIVHAVGEQPVVGANHIAAAVQRGAESVPIRIVRIRLIGKGRIRVAGGGQLRIGIVGVRDHTIELAGQRAHIAVGVVRVLVAADNRICGVPVPEAGNQVTVVIDIRRLEDGLLTIEIAVAADRIKSKDVVCVAEVDSLVGDEVAGLANRGQPVVHRIIRIEVRQERLAAHRHRHLPHLPHGILLVGHADRVQPEHVGGRLAQQPARKVLAERERIECRPVLH